jgi:ABC-type uncharacterized transport system auxiliary subunit
MTRIGLMTAALLVASSCAPHRIQYYQLSAFENRTATVDAGPAMLVGRIAATKALEDGRIRYREGPNAVGAYEFHRWTDPPGIMVKEALIQVLRASGKYRSVEEAGSSAAGDYLVRGKLLEFAELDGPAIQTRVSLDLELRDMKTGRMVWDRIFTHDDPVQAKTVADVVQSLDRNLKTVLGESADAIGLYTGTHPLAPRL